MASDEREYARRRAEERQQSSWFKLKEGDNRFRILPTPITKTARFRFFEYSVHRDVGPKKQVVRCGINPIDRSGDCWLCNVKIPGLKKKGLDERAKALAARDNFLIQVAKVDDSDRMTGPFLFTPAKTVADQLLTSIFGAKKRSYLDPEAGYNISINRTGTGKNDTRYGILEPDQEPTAVPKKILEKLKPFEELKEVPVYSAAKQQAAYNGKDIVEDEEEEETPRTRRRTMAARVEEDAETEEDIDDAEDIEEGETEEDEEEEPAAKPAKKQAKKHAPPVEEEEEDEPTDDEEEAVDEEGDDPAPPPKKKPAPKPGKKAAPPPDEDEDLDLDSIEDDEADLDEADAVDDEEEEEAPPPKKKIAAKPVGKLKAKNTPVTIMLKPKTTRREIKPASGIEEPEPTKKAKQPEVSQPSDVESFVQEIDADAIQRQVEKMLKFSTFEPSHRYRLNTGYPLINAVFGSEESGIPYGRIVELSGLEHGGKTLWATIMMGMAQRDGAGTGYVDLEESRDEQWATKLGVIWPYVSKFYPKLVAPKKGLPFLQSAEHIFEEAERGMELLAARGVDKQFWFIDSIANIMTQKQYDVGLVDANMNSKLDRSAFLSVLLPRWAGLAANYNALIFVSNQLRAKIGGFGYGDQDETTGGRALRHACSVRVRVRRIKGGRLKQGKAIVGLAGALRNMKNKSGEGSREGAEAGFKVLWHKQKASFEVMSIDELRADMGEEG